MSWLLEVVEEEIESIVQRGTHQGATVEQGEYKRQVRGQDQRQRTPAGQVAGAVPRKAPFWCTSLDRRVKPDLRESEWTMSAE